MNKATQQANRELLFMMRVAIRKPSREKFDDWVRSIHR
jgi:hypothetical protein